MEIRVAEGADGAACAAIYRPIVENSWISFETEAPSPAEMSRRIDTALPRFPWLVACENDAVAGYAYAGSHRERAAYRWSVDVTIYLAEWTRRRGVGSKLYAVLLDLLRRQGFRSAFAGIALPNAASEGLHRAAGFEPVGIYRQVGYKLGDWRDVGWWRLGLSLPPGAPVEPIVFSELRKSPDFGGWLG